MKHINKIICAVFLLAIFASLGEISLLHWSVSTAQDKALAFIENVLPIDSSRYNITLRNYGVPKLPDIGSYKQRDAEPEEILTYSLESKDSVLDVICTIKGNVLYICNVYVVNGSVITDRPYANLVDVAQSFLEKYQAYSKIDSTEMIDTLSDVDPTKNTTITSGALKLTVTHKDLSDTVFGDSINFRWVRTFNGCDYPTVNVVFRNGVFSGIIDQRAIYSIGDTAVNISEEQAIKIAMEYIKNYSYRMSDDIVITDFNVTEDRTVASLIPTVRESNVLYPYWSVTLYLNQTYPGSINALLVGIWADSGEVFFCHHQGTGGSDLISDGNSGSEPPTTSTSP